MARDEEDNVSVIEDMFIEIFKELSPNRIKKIVEPLSAFIQDYIKTYVYLFYFMILLILILQAVIIALILTR
jgi:hypothetical protein